MPNLHTFEDKPCDKCGCIDYVYVPANNEDMAGYECYSCGKGFIPADEVKSDDEGPQMTDVEADADTLASAGMGTDEDYGYFGDQELCGE